MQAKECFMSESKQKILNPINMDSLTGKEAPVSHPEQKISFDTNFIDRDVSKLLVRHATDDEPEEKTTDQSSQTDIFRHGPVWGSVTVSLFLILGGAYLISEPDKKGVSFSKIDKETTIEGTAKVTNAVQNPVKSIDPVPEYVFVNRGSFDVASSEEKKIETPQKVKASTVTTISQAPTYTAMRYWQPPQYQFPPMQQVYSRYPARYQVKRIPHQP